MSLETETHQMSGQPELPMTERGEASGSDRSGEACSATHENGRSGNDDEKLLELVVESSNVEAALRRVKKNKGSPGIDGMTVEELPTYLAGHWTRVREEILAGRYKPKPVRRHKIPKKDGGFRELGIPTVIDRLIQQCILHVLQPRFDPTFSQHSHGFRPGRSAHDAVRAAQRFIQEGRRWVVDVDLEAFFDRVNHDVLMSRLAKRIADRRLLGLIRRYLEAGVMANGVVVKERYEGTPQGGPLSPLLANVLLDEVDKELEKRGHAFARYADDCNVYVRSKRAGERVMGTLRRLFAGLRLRINESKSAVARPQGRKFLGYSFWVANGEIKRRVATKALEAMKDRIRGITKRSGGRSITSVVDALRSYLVGWKNYFQLADTPRIFDGLDKWIRRRLRAIHLKQWKRGTTTYRELVKRGVYREPARKIAANATSYWRSSGAEAIGIALPNSYFDSLGLPRLAATSTR